MELAEKEVSELRNRQEQSAGEARSAVDIVAEKERLLEETGRKLCTRILNDHEQFPEAGMLEVFDSLGDNIKNFQESRNSEVTGAAQDQMADNECNWNVLLKQIQTLLGTWKTLLQEEGTRLNTAQKTLRNLQDALRQVEEQKKSGKTAVEECGQKLTAAAASAKSAEALLKQLNDSREYPSEEAAMTEFNQAKGKWKAAEAVSKEAEKKEKSLKGIIYNVPGKASIEISMNKKTLYKGEAQITQFGTREGLAPVMFEDKKAPVKVYFYPETGAIKQIIQ